MATKLEPSRIERTGAWTARADRLTDEKSGLPCGPCNAVPLLKYVPRPPNPGYVKTQTGSFLRAVPEVDERRQHQRVEPQGGTVELVMAGQPATFGIDNLSEGGALIAGKITIDPGSAFELRINLPGAAAIPMWGRVLRHMPRAGEEYTAVLFLSSSGALANWISEVVLQGLRAAFPEL